MCYLKCEIHVQVTPEERLGSFISQKLLSCGISPTLARNKLILLCLDLVWNQNNAGESKLEEK